uniref:Uncharacterized protein n=1 Tax=Micrurus spixii TaxID=129469 RepID=A0A2D4M1S7_9SAUR
MDLTQGEDEESSEHSLSLDSDLEEGEIWDPNLSEEKEDLKPDQPPSASVFQLALFKPLLHKALVTAQLSAEESAPSSGTIRAWGFPLLQTNCSFGGPSFPHHFS